jgi:hypothetical protein
VRADCEGWRFGDCAERFERGRSRVGVVFLGLAGLLALLFPRVASANRPQGSLIILVYNYKQAPLMTMARAEREAGKILAEAGIQTLWLNCFPRGGESELCRQANGPDVVILRMLASPGRTEPADVVSGFAIGPALATVYYDEIPSLPGWDKDKSDFAIVLGCIMSHEIGHLLLGPGAHSAGGIMRGRWDFEQLRLAMMGMLTFLPEQSKLMQAEMRARIRQKTASFAAALSSP